MLYERNYFVFSRGSYGMIFSKRKLFGKLNNILFLVIVLYLVYLVFKNVNVCNVYLLLILKN